MNASLLCLLNLRGQDCVSIWRYVRACISKSLCLQWLLQRIHLYITLLFCLYTATKQGSTPRDFKGTSNTKSRVSPRVFTSVPTNFVNFHPELLKKCLKTRFIPQSSGRLETLTYALTLISTQWDSYRQWDIITWINKRRSCVKKCLCWILLVGYKTLITGKRYKKKPKGCIQYLKCAVCPWRIRMRHWRNWLPTM